MSRGKNSLKNLKEQTRTAKPDALQDLSGRISNQLAFRFQELLTKDPKFNSNELKEYALNGSNPQVLVMIACLTHDEHLVGRLNSNPNILEADLKNARYGLLKTFRKSSNGVPYFLREEQRKLIKSTTGTKADQDFLTDIVFNESSFEVFRDVVACPHTPLEALRKKLPVVIKEDIVESLHGGFFFYYSYENKGHVHPLHHETVEAVVKNTDWDLDKRDKYIHMLLRPQMEEKTFPILFDLNIKANRRVDYLSSILDAKIKVPSLVLSKICEDLTYPMPIRMKAANHPNYPNQF